MQVTTTATLLHNLINPLLINQQPPPLSSLSAPQLLHHIRHTHPTTLHHRMPQHPIPHLHNALPPPPALFPPSSSWSSSSCSCPYPSSTTNPPHHHHLLLPPPLILAIPLLPCRPLHRQYVVHLQQLPAQPAVLLAQRPLEGLQFDHARFEGLLVLRAAVAVGLLRASVLGAAALAHGGFAG
ncbi:hypothetical protein BFW01_g11656 [Lasiodiplodia theobromae]|nr:hypothetical protein BFW01_g11656 [Lasiodiplodia theobromae]